MVGATNLESISLKPITRSVDKISLKESTLAKEVIVSW